MNTTTTSEETGALAPAPLTIETKNLDKWLRWAKEAQNAQSAVFRTYQRTKQSSLQKTPMWDAYWICKCEWENMVEHVRDRGGLLLIGGKA